MFLNLPSYFFFLLHLLMSLSSHISVNKMSGKCEKNAKCEFFKSHVLSNQVKILKIFNAK